MELDWVANHFANCCYAAEGLARGLQPADARVGEPLIDPARLLQQEIAAAGLPAEKFWQHLLAFSFQADDHTALARLVLRKTIGPNAPAATVARLGGHILSVASATNDVLPRLSEELEHRIRPLQQQWEARGAGLLRAISGLTDARLFVERAKIVVVHPTFGGGGVANLMTNSVLIEAVLANVIPELPEVVRLGWLLAQLNHELPTFSDRVRGDRLSKLAQLAMLPPTLAASQAVELSSLSIDTLRAALAGWRIDVATEADLPALLLDWWATYRDTRPTWDIAIAALDRMLGV
jgi:hypothetical protein